MEIQSWYPCLPSNLHCRLLGESGLHRPGTGMRVKLSTSSQYVSNGLSLYQICILLSSKLELVSSVWRGMRRQHTSVSFLHGLEVSDWLLCLSRFPLNFALCCTPSWRPCFLTRLSNRTLLPLSAGQPPSLVQRQPSPES